MPHAFTALYFSRSLIPHGEGAHYHHIGIYAYRRAALEKFVGWHPSPLEKRERLEQRARDNERLLKAAQDALKAKAKADEDTRRKAEAEAAKAALSAAETALATALSTADVIGAYAGLRPLLDTGAGRTADVSRDHAVIESDSGVFSVVGGKLTEYRHMAEDVLDTALTERGVMAGGCRTRNLPLVGAPANPVATLRTTGELPGSLMARYGAESPNVIASARCARPTDPVAEGIDVTRAEF